MGDEIKCFHVHITGQIEYAHFPLGLSEGKLFAKFNTVVGPDWDIVHGNNLGISQTSFCGKRFQDYVINLPYDVTYKSTNVSGWPQIIVCLYSVNRLGVNTCKGYARFHLPISEGESTCRAPIMMPQYSDLCSTVGSWITQKNPEIQQPTILCKGNKNKGLMMKHTGDLIATFYVLKRGFDFE